jgi:hypothetical protein
MKKNIPTKIVEINLPTCRIRGNGVSMQIIRQEKEKW